MLILAVIDFSFGWFGNAWVSDQAVLKKFSGLQSIPHALLQKRLEHKGVIVFGIAGAV